MKCRINYSKRTLTSYPFQLVKVASVDLWMYASTNSLKQLDQKAKVNFNISDVINWITNNLNTQTSSYLKK